MGIPPSRACGIGLREKYSALPSAPHTTFTLLGSLHSTTVRDRRRQCRHLNRRVGAHRLGQRVEIGRRDERLIALHAEIDVARRSSKRPRRFDRCRSHAPPKSSSPRHPPHAPAPRFAHRQSQRSRAQSTSPSTPAATPAQSSALRRSPPAPLRAGGKIRTAPVRRRSPKHRPETFSAVRICRSKGHKRR